MHKYSVIVEIFVREFFEVQGTNVRQFQESDQS